MGWWTFLKAVAKFCVASLTGYELAGVIDGDAAAKNLEAAKRELKNEFDELKKELSSLKVNGHDDMKILLFIILAFVAFMLVVWLFGTGKRCLAKFFKKSVTSDDKTVGLNLKIHVLRIQKTND